MPAQTAKSILAGLGLDLARTFNENKNKPVQLSFGGQLPPGINNGVAHLKEMKLDVYKSGQHKDKPYWQAKGIVVEPKEHVWIDHFGVRKSQHVEGDFTMIQEALCHTPEKTGDNARKTAQAHLNWILDNLRNLGWNPTEVTAATDLDVEKYLNAAMASLIRRSTDPKFENYSPIYFRFRTWAGKPMTVAKDDRGRWCAFEVDKDGNPSRPIPGRGPYLNENEARMKNPGAGNEPQVQSTWGGILENYTPKVDDGVDDQSGPATYDPTATSTNGEGAVATAPVETIQEPEPPFDEFGGLDDLVAKASEDDSAAKEELIQKAVAAGYEEQEALDAENWEEVKEMILNPRTEGAAAETEKEDSPNVGNVVKYHPILPKTGKPAKNAVECEIKTVNKGEKTVTLLDLKDRKTTYSKVKWTDLK